MVWGGRGRPPPGMLSPRKCPSFLLSPAPSACRSQNAPSIPCKGGDPMSLRLLPLLLALLALWGCAPQSMPAPSAVPTPTATQALTSPSPSPAGVPAPTPARTSAPRPTPISPAGRSLSYSYTPDYRQLYRPGRWAVPGDLPSAGSQPGARAGAGHFVFSPNICPPASRHR